MDYRKLGPDGVRVSALCLGTMTWGQQNDEREAHAQMDLAVERGINFFDSAELYPIPPKRQTQGRTEDCIGTWLKARGRRDDIVLATKVVGRSRMDWFRDGARTAELARDQIREAVEKSLHRLQTDYIDLYQVHWPDRPLRLFGGLEYQHYEKPSHPIEDSLAALAELVDEGKVRMLGVSNETPWGTMQYLIAAGQKGLPRIVSIQNAYSLVNRSFETGLSEVAFREGVGLLAYSPLAQGYLTGKYEDGACPQGSRKQLFDRLGRYESESGLAAVSAYVALAREHGLDPAQMAIRFVTDRPFVVSNIIGATSIAQLEANIASSDVTLSEEVLAGIERIHRRYTNPSP